MTKTIAIVAGVFLSCMLFAQGDANQTSDDKLLKEYVQSKGNNTIIFDAENIKRFWIDKSVAAMKNEFNILLNNNSHQFESVPLKIQLANVNEAQDCKIEVVAEKQNFNFSVLNTKKKVISVSKKENGFINYSILSSSFHLEDTQNLTFELKFSSTNADILSIKQIILSFSENKTSNFLASPGKVVINHNAIETSSKILEKDATSFSVTGKNSSIFITKKILVSDKGLSTTAKIKNTGETASRVYFGYAIYTADGLKLDGRNYPFKNTNKVLTVVSASKGSDKIIVDNYTDWAKNCYIALNAEEDLSDIPNRTFVGGRIIEMKKLENGQAEITLEKKLDSEIQNGTKIRIHGLSGAFLYTSISILQPGDEQIFASMVEKNDNILEYSTKAFPRGVYYVVPLILSYSVDTSKENTILISDFSISY